MELVVRRIKAMKTELAELAALSQQQQQEEED
jgi:hypothetical protein